MAKLSLIQGDSLAYDVYTDDIATFDVNWGGSWAIVDAIPTVNSPLASGTLAISGDSTKLEARVLPADSNVIPVGKYYFIVEVTNATIHFNQEVMQEEITIKPQGI